MTTIRPQRYDQCDDTCTVDCGHCKGKGRPGRVADAATGPVAAVPDTTQPDPQVVAWMRDRMSEAPYGMTAKDVRAYREANGLSAEDMTAAYCVAARKPLTVADIPAGQGAPSLFIGRAPDGCPVLTFKDEDGDLIALEHGNPTTPSGRAFWQHLAATLPPVTEDEEPQP